MQHENSFNTLIWLIAWAFIGSTLGYFTIRYKLTWTKEKKLIEYFKSVCVGIFFSLPVYFVLYEIKELSQNLSLTLAGSSSFAVTDLIIKIWPKVISSIEDVLYNLAKKLVKGNGNSDRYPKDKEDDYSE